MDLCQRRHKGFQGLNPRCFVSQRCYLPILALFIFSSVKQTSHYSRKKNYYYSLISVTNV